MKKIGIICLTISILCITGCNNKNDDITIKLEGNPTTGYDWNCIAEDSSIITIEKEYEQSNSDEMITGAGGIYEFEIEGLKEGSTKLICKYERSFEENSTIEKKEYVVTVDKNKNISYKEIK